ncbi:MULTISPECIES: cation:proton antiporter [Vibrio]|jgi:NhaP-type Na+/H+ or K+/H+ antiporter|uniref:Sodium:proton antiporter n=2 Tax=Vibrio harveyi group TaxID=717610 RepID=A0A7H8DXG9_VIBAL|nr:MULTISPECIES: sodium:proton antiporter [Vibrio]EID0030497.1 sodium:proton antiporter [Vibrio alginolyticus]EJG0479598.1 sodium:proton antiporter [Vibrio alginolyticus]EKA3119392.1 sodium:proton antiporter [Vibrio alginolyticus]ELB2849285.1 sodium:proton antiporter [Vibrio alginolyticus]MBY7682155.1 sodium:proton antiporter [Vibrio alginolyticus]
MQVGNEALVLSAVGVIGLGCQWLAWRLRLPAILFLLLAGLIVGPFMQWLNPDEILGNLLFPLVSLAVAVILFEGSLTLNFKEIRGVSGSVWSIVSIGAIISWAATSIATHYFLGFTWELAMLFGSLTVVTGPTVIVPLLRTVRPNSTLANILRWEGILIDPLGALFVVMVYEFIVSHSAINSVEVFGTIIAVGVMLGAASGYAVATIMRRSWLPEYLQPFAVLMVVLGVFSVSNHIESEAGLLTVTVMGMWLANAKDINIQQILHFKEHLTILLITGLFIFLAARISLDDFAALGSGALLLFVFMQLVSRPLSIFLSTFRSNLRLKDKLFLSWVAPRGIVAASISSLFAIKLTEYGIDEAILLVPMTFMVIIGTVVLQSATARPVALTLGVAEPAPRGFLLIGANRVAREIGQALSRYDRRVLMTDSNWEYISQVRMLGLDYYYGNPISSHADDNLNLIGIGQVVALTPDQHFNIMACMQFVDEFGEDKVHCLQKVKTNVNGSEKHSVAQEYHGKLLMGGNVSYTQLASMLSRGAEVKHTKLSDNFTYQDYLAHHKGSSVVPLFHVEEKGKIQFCDDPEQFEPTTTSTVVSLILSDSVK